MKVDISKEDRERLLKIAEEATERTPEQLLEAMDSKPTLFSRMYSYQAQYDYYSRRVWDMLNRKV